MIIRRATAADVPAIVAMLADDVVVQFSSDKTRVDAHRFYRRLGFVQSHEGFKLPLS